MSLTAILSSELTGHLILVLKVSMNRNLYRHLFQVRVRSNGAISVVSSHFFDIILAGSSATANVDSIVDSVKVVVNMQQLMQLILSVCLCENCYLLLKAREEYITRTSTINARGVRGRVRSNQGYPASSRRRPSWKRQVLDYILRARAHLPWSAYFLLNAELLVVGCYKRMRLTTSFYGICSCHCVYFCVNQLYSNCFVSKIAPVCIVLARYLTLFWQRSDGHVYYRPKK